MYGLPGTLLVNRRLPKEAFYRNASLTAAQKDEFVHGIEKITMLAAIEPAHSGIPAAGSVQEVDVVRVDLKGGDLPEDALRVICSAAHNKVLMVCAREGLVCLAAMRGRLRVGAWVDEAELDLTLAGADLAAVWDSLCARVVYGDACGEGLDERMARDAEIDALAREIEQINKKRRSERQVAKRNALFQRLRAAQARLAELKESC